MFIYLEGIKTSYAFSPSQTSLELVVKSLQIDNQLYFTPFPTMVRPINMECDFFQVSLVKSNEYPTIEFYNYFSVLMQEIDLQVDSSLVNALLKFVDIDFDAFGGENQGTQITYGTKYECTTNMT